MERLNVIRRYAVGTVFSDTAGLGFEDLISKLEEGNIPDDVLVWEFFEHLGTWELLRRVEDFCDILLEMERELKMVDVAEGE